ncbi:type II secretion system F family protein [Asaia sp. W19]|uniref:type II secretion system F family protein n=1 Tax=unclassified Asaia TaxID=2685023 RepID=UPI000F8D51E5|nr:type II secretion system F family protein [Asaia sp. W19]RUT26474.1 type II secretion system F family protein [Asaia sp. W19]
MSRYAYQAIDTQGALIKGSLEAASEAEAVAALRRLGHIPIRVGPSARPGLLRGLSGPSLALVRRGLKRNELAAATRELAVMLGAGQDIDRALRFLIETAQTTRGGTRSAALFGAVRDQVRDGRALHQAMGAHPDSFPKLYLGMVRAAEATGDLAPTMARLADLLERERALAATVQSAMIYPAILTLTAIGSVTLLLTKVLPQFTPLFAQNGVALPRSTQMLVQSGALIGHYGWAMLLAVGVSVVLARRVLALPTPRRAVDGVMLRLPGLGPLLAEILAARLARILGTLLTNGVPLLGALAIVRDSLGNLAALDALAAASESVKSGGRLARPLEESRLFPRRLVHLLQLGEETAQLGPMALRAADIHEDQARLAIQRLVAVLVPAITIVMGLMVAGIVSSLLLAMLSLNDLAQ